MAGGGAIPKLKNLGFRVKVWAETFIWELSA